MNLLLVDAGCIPIVHGSLNVPIEHHPTIRYMVYNGYYKVMSNIPKMGHLPTPAVLLGLLGFTTIQPHFSQQNLQLYQTSAALAGASASGLRSNQDRAAPEVEERVPNIDFERDLTKHFLIYPLVS